MTTTNERHAPTAPAWGPPAPPAYPPAYYQPGYAPLPPGPPRQPRLWPALVTAGVIGAAVASIAAGTITAQVRDNAAPAAPESVTITVPAPVPPAPAPLPVAQANLQTCAARATASQLISDASTAQGVIPPSMTILDPAVRSNADWTAAVQRAGDLYRQAGDTLQNNIAPGATPILTSTITTAAHSLRALGDAYATFDPASGNARDAAKEASDAMDVVCKRLAP